MLTFATVFVLVGLGFVLVGVFADVEFVGVPFSALGVGLAAFGFFAGIGFLFGLGAAPSLLVGLVLALFGLVGLVKVMGHLPNGDEPFAGLGTLVGGMVTVQAVSDDGVFVEVSGEVDGVPVRLVAEDVDGGGGVLSRGDEVLVLEVLSPTRVLVKRI